MDIDHFVRRWRNQEGGAERSNYVPYTLELLQALDLPTPDPACATTARNDYVFERAVCGGLIAGAPRRIDLYKRGCFVMEHKQSRWPRAPKAAAFGETPPSDECGPRGGRGWDAMMRHARRQALGYVSELPPDHPAPPFVIICDVARSFEIWADFTGTGRGHAPFPDRNSFRFSHDDLLKPEIQARLRAIWTDPLSLDPTRISAQVTREIAEELAIVSRSLEDRGVDGQHVAYFLMRCIFTIFAADVGLLPKAKLIALLHDCLVNPRQFAPMFRDLWFSITAEDPEQRFFSGFAERVPLIGGELFADTRAYDLEREEIASLLQAAQRCWRQVEPAIFGSLLENALAPAERRKLGAHYTPRRYVVQLVDLTIIEPLRAGWTQVQTAAEQARDDGDVRKAVTLVRAFHHRLTQTRVLDPACGTGNFLYVALELMTVLEAEVLEMLTDLGETDLLGVTTIDPGQFLGLEVNPRAVAIADMVLTVGFLQQHYRSHTGHPSEPVLKHHGAIQWKDALVDWDGAPAPQHAWRQGKVVQVWPNARQTTWPQADFIVGNPPFIGGKDLRGRLDPGYCDVLWRLYPRMNESADFVMYWWERAAEALTRPGTRLNRFGLVTTNSITQVFQRKTTERWLTAARPLSLVYAVPDHPWTRAGRDNAAVRIAMTVAEAGSRDGALMTVVSEAELQTDTPRIDLALVRGRINADLSVGADVTAARPLKANAGLCSPGVKLHGGGFLISAGDVDRFGLRRRAGADRHLRPYRSGRDLVGRSRDLLALDFQGVSSDQLRDQYPEAYQYLSDQVRTARAAQFERSPTPDARAYLDQWWLFGKSRPELRDALQGLPRYIATVETAKHRVFQFLDAAILPDNTLVNIAEDDAATLAILSSRIHTVWALRAGGWLGVGNDSRYTKSRCFDAFAFPDLNEASRRALRQAGEALDAHRGAVLAAHPDLTLTALYNVLDQFRAGDLLTPGDEAVRRHGLVMILAERHDDVDRLTAQAYGWSTDLSDAQIIDRLVELNRARVQEEAGGQVRWLRPGWQAPRAAPLQASTPFLLPPAEVSRVTTPTPFPRVRHEQPLAVQAMLRQARSPIASVELARRFRGGGRRIEPRISQVLATLHRYGHVEQLQDGRWLANP